MKIILEIIILFIFSFQIIFAEGNPNGEKLPGGAHLGYYFVIKDLEIKEKGVNYRDYILLDKINYDDFESLINLGKKISINHTIYDLDLKNNFKYSLGIIDLKNKNLYYISELICDKNGKIIINSGKYKNFPTYLGKGKELFYDNFKTCNDLENFFDGYKKYKFSIENNFDIRYILFFIKFLFSIFYFFLVFIFYKISLKILKKQKTLQIL